MLLSMGDTTPPCGTPLSVSWYCQSSRYPGLEHVTDQPEKPVIVDLLCQYPEKNLVAETAEAVRDITLDKPHGPGPGPLYFPQRGMTAPPFPEPMRPARKLRLVIRLQQ